MLAAEMTASWKVLTFFYREETLKSLASTALFLQFLSQVMILIPVSLENLSIRAVMGQGTE